MPEQHKAGCNFLGQVANDFSGIVGEGEISGSVSLGRNPLNGKIELSMHDGWNDGVYIDFKYCPCCGVKLKEEE